MKKLWIGLSTALLVGVGLGYLIFSNSGEAHLTETGEAHQKWTCSMHPQILQSDPGKCPICGMDLIPAGTESNGGLGIFHLTAHAEALANIQAMQVGTGTSGVAPVQLSGSIQPNEKAVASQSAYFGGRIETLHVNYVGENVKKGQLLATLYAPELVAAQQELLIAKSNQSRQPELYQAVRKKLEYWKLSGTQISEIEKSGVVLDRFPIYAQVSGTVSAIDIVAGDYVKGGQRLFQIADLTTLWGVFDVYENQLQHLRLGDSVQIRIQGVPGTTFAAKIDFIGPTLDAATRTTAVRVQLPKIGTALKPGMFLFGTLFRASNQDRNHVVIPETAVMWTGERSVVYVKPNPSEPEYQMREVRLGKLLDSGYEVLGGVSQGEWIITHGTFTVDAAAQLQGANSMMHSGRNLELTGLHSEDQGTYRDLLQHYLVLKDALVADNFGKAQRTAQTAQTQLGNQMNSPVWRPVFDLLQRLSATDDIGQQRDAFLHLSEFMIQIGLGESVGEQTVYVQYCPMANNAKGASWLSVQEQIRNPYYGAAMLTCGSIQEIWKTN